MPKRLTDIDESIDWQSISAILIGHYQVDASKQVADVCPHLLLFKYLLLRKWFQLG